MQVDYSGRMASVYRAGRSLPVSVVTAWVDAAVRHVDRDAAGVVCDLGSGTGRFSAVLASCLGPPLVAIEPAAGMREQARMQTPRRCASLLGEAEQIPIRGSVVSVVWMSQTIHHYFQRNGSVSTHVISIEVDRNNPRCTDGGCTQHADICWSTSATIETVDVFHKVRVRKHLFRQHSESRDAALGRGDVRELYGRFSGVRVKERYLSLFADFSVKASNSGRLLFSRSFNNRTQLPNFAPSEAIMCVARFAGSITPSVVLMYSDYGSNCCVYVDGFSLAPSNRTGAYAGIVEFQDAIRGMTRAKGHVVVVGVDNSFSGAFGAQAGNALPIKIYEFRDGKFVDTTRNYLGLIARDAAQWLRTFKSQTTAVHDLAPLAAWVADEDLLRKSSSAWNYVDQLESEGSSSPDQITGQAEPLSFRGSSRYWSLAAINRGSYRKRLTER